MAFSAGPPWPFTTAGRGGDDLRGTSHPSTPWGRADLRPGPPGLHFSLEDTSQLSRSVHNRSPPCRPKAAVGSGCFRTPLLRISKDRPSVGVSFERPLPAPARCARSRKTRSPAAHIRAPKGPNVCRLRPGDATLRTRYALVVPPDFGVFLRSIPCRFVAPCSRPWGSPRFDPSAARPRWPRRAARSQPAPEISPKRTYPSKLFPRRKPFRVTAAIAFSPSNRTPCTRFLPRTEGNQLLECPSPGLKALLHRRIRCSASAFPRGVARCFLGLLTHLRTAKPASVLRRPTAKGHRGDPSEGHGVIVLPGADVSRSTQATKPPRCGANCHPGILGAVNRTGDA